MPYVPSLKTDGKSQDRILIDASVEGLAKSIANSASANVDILKNYWSAFYTIGDSLKFLSQQPNGQLPGDSASDLALVIFTIGVNYGYQGAFLGELNYAITRLIQRVPQLMVESGKWAKKDEIRYWLYAMTVEALIGAADSFKSSGIGIGGVFEDIKDEYKRRVNPSYEAAQIVKSGDCYDTPYYNRLVRIVDEDGKEVGKILVDMVRSEETLHKDVLDAELVARVKVNTQL